MTRDRSVGPEIDGLTLREHLGSGGYSEVYLYEQRKPRMRVAVKVLIDARLSDAELGQFAAEAETMAELADHPYIVQVFSTGVTKDGRPYLVMKYYPPPNLGQRAATERFPVADVLRTGIQISSAVETAHRAGILHRDIKPANILVSQYNEPGLADFGIAGKAGEPDGDDDLGVSIPWSPPEVLNGSSNGSVASDVYSLAATLWHLLAGRSPHEVPRGDNSPRALMGRILRSAPPATGRGDVPASLERLLQQSMSKVPAHRPTSALHFARALQTVEQELRYTRTEIIVDDLTPARAPIRAAEPDRAESDRGASRASKAADEASPATKLRRAAPSPFAPTPSHEPVELPQTSKRPARPTETIKPPEFRPQPAPRAAEPESTRLRPAKPSTPAPRREFTPGAGENEGTRLRPAKPSTPAPRREFTSGAGENEGTRLRPAKPSTTGGVSPRHRQGLRSEPIAPETTRRPVVPPGEVDALSTSSEPSRRRRGVKTPVAAVVAALVVVAAVIIGIVVMSSGPNKPTTSGTPAGPVGTDQGGIDANRLKVPAVTHAYNASTHKLTFRWSAAPGSGPRPKYSYSIVGGKGPVATTKTNVRVKTNDPTSVCIVVGIVASDGTVRLPSDLNGVCG